MYVYVMYMYVRIDVSKQQSRPKNQTAIIYC